jgi:hypothetical protein
MRLYLDPSNLTASPVQEQYPGWTMRLYLDPSNLTASSVGDLCDLSCSTGRLVT